MKISTQIVDAIRNIQKQKVSWFSICMIVALGIASYLGTIFAADAIKQAGQGFYDETSFRDIQLVSTLLFSDEDLKSVEELDGVEAAEGLYQTTAVVQNGSRNRTVQVQSLTERVSVPIVLDGRLPKKPTECVMEATLMDRLGLAVGDSISLLNTKGNTAKYLIQPNYVIVGRVLHPDHITARLPENLYVLVQKEAFNPFETFQSYMRAEVRVEDGRRFNTFEADYFRSIEGIQEELGNIGVERSKLRDTIIWGKLKEMEAYLRDARNTYNAARRLLVLSENGKENADSLQKRNDELWHSFAERIKQDFGIDVMYLAESYAKRIDQSLEEANEALTEFDRTLDRTEEQYRAIRNMVEQVGACRWFSFDRRANAAFVDLSMVADSLQSLAMSFSMLFIVVGALVCYATIGRMADEQRSLIGAEKALGFFEGEIFRKYLIFGASGVGLGIGAGIWLGYYGMQSIICQGYADMYVFGEAAPSFVSDVTIVVTILGLLLAAAAAFFACHRLLSRTATVLMKGEVVKRDWKRILITAVSVGGCMALLVIGFSLKFAVDGVMDKQYGEIVKYDKKIRFNPDASVSVADDIEKALSKAGADYLRVSDAFTTYQVSHSMELAELICGDGSRFNEFFAVKKVGAGGLWEITKDGILIQKRLAEVYGLKPGDTFSIFDTNASSYQAVVAGVFENYTGRTMVISKEYYEKLFGTPSAQDTFFVKTDGVDEKALTAALRKIKGFTSISRSDTSRTLFASISAVLNAVIVLLIVLAAIMAAVVQLNLANLYVMQKKKELCIMRVNGFTIAETIRYVSREIVATTLAGLAAGLFGGMALAYWIIRLLEKPHIQLVRTPNPIGIAASAAITMVFAFAVNAFALRKVGQFKLTDVMDS